MQDSAEAGLWRTLQQLDTLTRARHVRLLPMTAEIVIRAEEIRDQLKLSPADALVLATVVEYRGRRGPNHFLSRDQGFNNSSVRQYMEQFGVVYHAHASSYLRAIRQR
jgi:predicted nucleic acid-binding protein